MTAQTVFQRAAEAYAARPEAHEYQQLAMAAMDWLREYRAQAAGKGPPAAEEPVARVVKPTPPRHVSLGGCVTRKEAAARLRAVHAAREAERAANPRTNPRTHSVDPTGTDPMPAQDSETLIEMVRRIGPTTPDIYPPQIRPPGIVHGPGSPLLSTPPGTGPASISERYPQDDFGRRIAPRRRSVEAWEDGPGNRVVQHTSPTGRLEHAQADFAGGDKP